MTQIRNPELLSRFGNHLRQLRLSKNLSQEHLANVADIPINQVGRIERGEINPTLSTLQVIANALDMSLPSLMDF
ncbi:MAG: helix-turn-helix transcriptional regulator [Cyclobacteriaceae bacterium]